MAKSQFNREIEELLRRIVADLLPNVGAKVGGDLMFHGCGTECENDRLTKQEGGT
jgi:hypothetical protein